MIYELRICGPAFGLTSIEAECTAAAYYVSRRLSRDQWSLVTTTFGQGEPDLPALYDPTVSRWISGYRCIVAHLSFAHQSTSSNATDGNTRRIEADNSALLVHICSSLQPLIDHHLYACQNHFVHFTRPAWTHLLHFPWNYTIPSAWRKGASRRALAAGISTTPSIFDIMQDEKPQQENLASAEASLSSSSPSLLFRSSRLLAMRTLAQERSSLLFKIEALIDEAIEPLNAALATQSGLENSEGADSWVKVECVAVAYVGLLLRYPGSHSEESKEFLDLVIPDRMKKRWPGVVKWVTDLQSHFTSLWESKDTTGHTVPNISDRGRYCLTYALDCILSSHKRQLVLQHTWPFSSNFALSAFAGVSVSLAWVAYGLFTVKGEREKTFLRPDSMSGLRSMGEAGALLGTLAGLGRDRI